MGKAPVKKVMAVRKFTDRDEPRAAFNRVFEDAQRHTDEFNVISYYGIGGFGKTRLINELSKQLDKYNADNEDLNKIAHVTYDFSRGTEKMFVLEKLRNLLKKQGLSFPYSDALDAAYNIKCGNPVYKTASEKDLLDNPMISIVADFIPGAKGLLSSIKTGKTIVEESTKYYKKIEKLWNVNKQNLDKELKAIGSLEINELEDKASYYFAQDMIHNTESVSDEFRLPVVIFLDTYEELVNSYKAADFASAYDIWLRDDIIKTIPGVMWVIGGREKLKWDEEDDFWNGVIEEHELGDLTKTDSFDFLRTAGIPEELLEDIYGVTGGTPLFLDLNVTTYYELLAAGKTITKESFGSSKEQVIERFLRYMNPDDQYIAKLLAVLENWSDEEAEIIGKATLPVFYKDAYKAFIEHTIIIKDNDQRYYMHQQVQKVILEAAKANNPEMVNQIYTEKIKYLMSLDTAGMNINERFTVADKIVSVFETAEFDNKTYAEMYRASSPLFATFYKEGIYSKFHDIYRRLTATLDLNYYSSYFIYYNYRLACENYANAKNAVEQNYKGLSAIRSASLALTFFPQLNSSGKQMLACRNVEAQLLFNLGKLEEAKNIFEESYREACEKLGNDSYEALRRLNNTGMIYDQMQDYERGLKIYTEVYNTACKTFGPENPYTLKTLNNIAIDNYNLKNYDAALENHTKSYQLKEKTLGSKNRATLVSLQGMAKAEAARGNYKRAIELYEKVYEDSEGVYEGNDYSFMISMAYAYKNDGDRDKAMSTLYDLQNIYRNYYGESHILTAGINKLINELTSSEALEQIRKTERPRITESATLFDKAQHYEALGDLETAASCYKQHYEMLNAADILAGETSEETMETAALLGACYFWLEKFSDALYYHKQYYEHYLKTDGFASSKTVFGLANICNCLEYGGKYAELEKYQLKLMQRYSSNKKRFYRAKFTLAFAYLMLDRKDECLTELKDIYDNREIMMENADKPNEFERLAIKKENHILLFSQEKMMLNQITRFLTDKDPVLHKFYEDIRNKRDEVMNNLIR